MDGQEQKYPLIVIMGMDPTKHEIPPLLKYHLKKMQKDFVIRFLSDEDLCKDVLEDLKTLLKTNGFVPKEKTLIQMPGSNIIQP